MSTFSADDLEKLHNDLRQGKFNPTDEDIHDILDQAAETIRAQILLSATQSNYCNEKERAEAATARADASEKDAKRYRWLRGFSSDGFRVIQDYPEGGDAHLMNEHLDAAIDAALAKS